MGVAEEAGKVATAAIDGFRSSPSCLFGMLLAAMMAALTFFALQANEENEAETRNTLIERCFPLQTPREKI